MVGAGWFQLVAIQLYQCFTFCNNPPSVCVGLRQFWSNCFIVVRVAAVLNDCFVQILGNPIN